MSRSPLSSQPEATGGDRANRARSPRSAWIAHLLDEQRQRWQAGKRPLVEAYRKQHPALAQDAPGLVDLIYNEIVLREQQGESPQLEEYLQRFPEHADVLRRQFSVHRAFPHDSSALALLEEAPSEEGGSSAHGSGKEVAGHPAASGSVETQGEQESAPSVRPEVADAPPGDSSPGDPEEQPSAKAEAGPTWLVGRYRLDRCVGRGGFGEVWQAFDCFLEKVVAVKRPRPDRVLSEEQTQSFLKEARKTASLKHPGIVVVHNVDRVGALWFIVSDFIEGMSLAEYLAQRRCSYGESARLVADIAGALHAAHLRGLIHRDVKPGNVLLDACRQPYLTDFGLAISEDEQTLERDRVAGTLAYMSPEQVRGKSHHLDGRSDVYSLGVVLYELLTGRRPFKGNTYSEFREQILHREPRPLRAIEDNIPSELERICLKCLAKEVANRYTTAKDLATELRAWLAGPEKVTPPSLVDADRTATAEFPSPKPERRKGPVLVLLALALLFAGLVLALGLGGFTESGAGLSGAARNPSKPTGPPTDTLRDDGKPRVKVRELVWPANQPICTWRVIEASNELRVYTDRNGMLQLGTASEDDFELSVGFRQVDRTGRLGLFFGYKEDQETGLARYQFIEVTYPNDRCKLYRLLCWFELDEPTSGHNREQHVLPTFARSESRVNRLRIVVRGNRLAEVFLNDEAYPELCGRVKNHGCKGPFGVSNFSSDGIYSRVLINGEPVTLFGKQGN